MAVQALLVVRDENGSQDLYRTALAGAGLTVSCESLASARKWDRSNSVDLLIIDLGLDNGLTGAAVAERLRQNNSSLSVIFLASEPLPYLMAAGVIGAEAFSNRQTAFLRTPLPTSVLIGKVGTLLGRSGARISLAPPEVKPLARAAGGAVGD